VHGNGREYFRLGMQSMEAEALGALVQALQRGEAV
jgi:hypothetical protein